MSFLNKIVDLLLHPQGPIVSQIVLINTNMFQRNMCVKGHRCGLNVFGFITWQGWVTASAGGGKNESESRLAEM